MKLIITESQYKVLLETDYRKVLDSKLIKDKITIDVLAKKYPQWDFSRARIRREKNSKGTPYRFLDGLDCPKHGISDNLNVSDLDRRGSGCRECGKERQVEKGFQKTELDQWVKILDEKGFIADSKNFEYIKNSSGKNVLYVKDLICKDCGGKIKKLVNVWDDSSDKVSCPKCSIGQWKGEKIVKDILKGMGLVEGVDYFPKYKFEGLKGKEHTRTTPTGGISKSLSLPYYFDFYIPNWNTIIEFDGEYHFNLKVGRHDEEKLEKYIYRDIKKNNFTKNNGIDLIRISYKPIHRKKEVIEKEINDALAELKTLRKKGGDENDKGYLITTGNYPKKGWNK